MAKFFQVRGYATDPNYSKKLIERIERFNLESYGRIAQENSEN